MKLHSITLPTRLSVCFAGNQKYITRKTIAQSSTQVSPKAMDLACKFTSQKIIFIEILCQDIVCIKIALRHDTPCRKSSTSVF